MILVFYQIFKNHIPNCSTVLEQTIAELFVEATISVCVNYGASKITTFLKSPTNSKIIEMIDERLTNISSQHKGFFINFFDGEIISLVKKLEDGDYDDFLIISNKFEQYCKQHNISLPEKSIIECLRHDVEKHQANTKFNKIILNYLQRNEQGVTEIATLIKSNSDNLTEQYSDIHKSLNKIQENQKEIESEIKKTIQDNGGLISLSIDDLTINAAEKQFEKWKKRIWISICSYFS